MDALGQKEYPYQYKALNADTKLAPGSDHEMRDSSLMKSVAGINQLVHTDKMRAYLWMLG
jgi:hypothetical protein